MPIHYEQDDEHVVIITIDRPEARNAADMAHFKALREAWERFADDDQAWVAIITGVGEAFFAGADLKTYVPEITKFQKEIAEKGLTEIDGYRLDDGTRSVLRNWPLYKPVIAAVNGFCTAGGMEMLGGCDIRVACPEAKFAVMEPKRGLFAGGGTTVRLPRQIPWPQAMEFLLCADLIPAERAFEMGLLNAIVPRDQLLDTARAYAARMIANAPLAVQATKESALKGAVRRRRRDHAGSRGVTRVARRAGADRRRRSRDRDRRGRGQHRGAHEARQGAAHGVREGESHLERDLPDRGRQGRPEGVRREAEAGLEGAVSLDPRTPCIIGVATHTWHPEAVGPAGAPEPLDMWEQVARAAAADAGAPALLGALDSLQIVYCQTWQYDDAVARLADRLGADPRHRLYSGIGGTTTQQLVNETSEAMLRGEMDLALITSAEALETKRQRKRAGERWTGSFPPADKRPFPWESPPDPVEVAHEVFQAWLTFAVFDNARRARLGTGLDDYRAAIGEMLAPMTRIAAHNPNAWFRIERSADEIIEPRPDNRMVGYPYTKYMVSVMDVDMAGALVLATHARADALGVPLERRVYPRGWCYARDPVLVAEHPDLTRSPAMAAASAEALRGAGVGVDDLAYIDLYSCFASSLHFARDALGLAAGDPRGVTLTGGLPYHGGPASGYLTHSIAALVERLRDDPGAAGIVSGVGMHMTKHVFGVYSGTPGPVAPPGRGCGAAGR